MKTLFNISAKLKSEKGVTLVYVAILLVVFLGIATLAVDVGYLYVGRTELQRAADAAALAATRQLGVIYEGMDYATQMTYNATTDAALIKAAAINVALQNRTAGTGVIIDPADIQIGTWNPTASPRFTPGLLHPDAVQVLDKRDNTSPSGNISTFFAPAFATLLSLSRGETPNPTDWQKPVSATATAALTAQSTMSAGGLPIPLGISEKKTCDNIIQLHPTKSSCAGWHGFFSGHNANWIAELMERQTFPASERSKKQWQDAPPFVSPEVNAYEDNHALWPDFTGGDLASNFDSFEKLFDYMKDRDGDGKPLIWTTSVLIYKDDADGTDCSNPNGPLEVVGFASFEITMVVGPSEKTFYGQLKCGFTEPGRGGGGYVGTKGSIPGLVQ